MSNFTTKDVADFERMTRKDRDLHGEMGCVPQEIALTWAIHSRSAFDITLQLT
jgi:hypothetical protein